MLIRLGGGRDIAGLGSEYSVSAKRTGTCREKGSCFFMATADLVVARYAGFAAGDKSANHEGRRAVPP